MPDNETPAKPARLTFADQLARQHELLMAAATKPARTSPPSVEFGERATGPDAGNLYLKSLVLVQGDTEEAVPFLGRQERTLRETAAMLAKLNAGDSGAAAADGGGE